LSNPLILGTVSKLERFQILQKWDLLLARLAQSTRPIRIFQLPCVSRHPDIVYRCESAQPSAIPKLKRYSGPAFIAVALVPGRPVYSLLLESCWQETNNQDRVYQELTLLAQSIGPVTCFCPYYETCHTTTVSAIAELFPHLRTLQLALVDHPSSDSYDMDDDSIIRDLVDSQEPGKSLLSYRVCSILRSDQTYLTAVAMCLLGVHPPNSFWSYQTPSEPRNFAVQPHGRFPRDARSPRTTATSSGHQRSRGCCSTDERSNSWPPREKEDLFYIP